MGKFLCYVLFVWNEDYNYIEKGLGCLFKAKGKTG